MAPIDDSILEKMRDDGNITPLAISREGEVERLDIGSAYAGVGSVNYRAMVWSNATTGDSID